MPNYCVILPAAGQSTRFGNEHGKKVFARLLEHPVWVHSAMRFAKRADVTQILLVISPEDRAYVEQEFASQLETLKVDLIDGGAERYDSIANALSQVNDSIDYIAVHDAARPCVSEESIDEVFQAAATHQAAMLAYPVSGTLKRVSDDMTVSETVSRQGIWEAQTPQVFSKELLEQAYAARQSLAATDDAQLVENLGKPVRIVKGSPWNLKITSPEDLIVAKMTLSEMMNPE
ncbi:MAG: 2-C-methyl-D-erythritol 4-phosphate cytidylyltransferase [Pirellulales bacterium]